MPVRRTLTVDARIDHGKFGVVDREAFREAVTTMPDGDYSVTLKAEDDAIRTKQRRYLWGSCYKLLSAETGTPDWQLHEIAKQKFLPHRVALCDGNGEIRGEYVVGAHWEELPQDERSEFIEHVVQWAAEFFGVILPDPDPEWAKKRAA